ncbi:uncharacterized protein LOC129780594 [Toxorhynchites rutilus septentrionalis]|uniref:uncharacterized protein LOC129780594 n=1 Tax=Toxorhynchites rutilus septentrionalis TaxID=329112 RepID=UPI0024799734|nr:uncharacterized protein LOC129780594 [Toxorhynchites rutilus septentrionalis]
MHRRSNVRQTRSQARALRERQANLHIGSDQALLRDPAKDNTRVKLSSDNERAEAFDCAGCQRPNNSEPMVRCRDCQCYWHYSCANVNSTTVHMEPFVCATCIQPIRFAPIRPSSSALSTHSVRQTRISRELERLEEERQLEEQIHRERVEQEKLLQERARRETLDRQRQFIARKYEILSQGDEDNDDLRSGSSSFRNSKIRNWLDEQAVSAVLKQSTPRTPKEATGGQNIRMLNLADQLAAVMDVETTGSITMEDSLGQRDEGAHAVERKLLQDPVYPPLSPVNVRTYYEFLEEPTTGAIPKVIKNETLYEK